jgi:hypothetical protein
VNGQGSGDSQDITRAKCAKNARFKEEKSETIILRYFASWPDKYPNPDKSILALRRKAFKARKLEARNSKSHPKEIQFNNIAMFPTNRIYIVSKYRH